MEKTWSHRYRMDTQTGVVLSIRPSFGSLTDKQFKTWCEKDLRKRDALAGLVYTGTAYRSEHLIGKDQP